MLDNSNRVIQFIGQSFCILDHLEIQVNDKVALVSDKALIFRKTESRVVTFLLKVTEKIFSPVLHNLHWKFEGPKSFDLLGFIHDPNAIF